MKDQNQNPSVDKSQPRAGQDASRQKDLNKNKDIQNPSKSGSEDRTDRTNRT